MSMMSAPAAAAISAPRTIHSASQPASCTICGKVPDLLSFRTMSWWPVASALLAIISDTTRPAPKRSARRRMGASVMPAMGARKARLGNV
jgi:hypothetical protein